MVYISANYENGTAIDSIFEVKPYLFHIDLWDAACFGMLFMCFTFSLLLGLARRRERSANRFLALALVVAMLGSARVVAISIGLRADWSWPFSLAFGPLLFFYVRKLTRPEQPFERRDLLHFSLLLLGFMPWLVFISVLIYLVWCRHLLAHFYHSRQFTSGDRSIHDFRWLKNWLTVFGLFWLGWIPVALLGAGAEPLYFLLMVPLVWLAARVFLREDTLPVLRSLVPAAVKESAAWLKNEVKVNRYYEDPALTLGSLAGKLELTTHELSRIINTAFKKSFNDFINTYRVQAVIRKMQDPDYDHITLLGIAYESGFNSKPTFNRIFKQVTGRSPVEYKKEVLPYNLRRYPGSVAVISNHQTTKSNRNFMLKNYFRIACRNLLKDRQFSLLNLLGLATGLACILLIALWVNDEWQVDKFNANDSRLYQVLKKAPDGTGSATVSEFTQGLLYQSLLRELPEIESAACLRKEREPGIILTKDRQLKAMPVFASTGFFKVFSYPLISGNGATALADVSGVLLSDQLALKLFHTTAVTGKTIKWQFQDNVDFSNVYTIRGVFQAPPANASDQFDLVFPFELYAQKMRGTPGDITSWGSNMVLTDVVLKPGTNVDAFNQKIRNFSKNKLKGDTSYEGDLFLQRYSDRYLYNNYVNGVPSGGRIEYVRLFFTIALLILVIACINFMNLATAKAARRMKEVGIQKVMGASRLSLVFQYLIESLLMTSGAFIMAVLIAMFLLPAFRVITGKDLQLHFSAGFIFPAIGLLVLVGLFAGSYPALYLSGFNPIRVLKGQLKTSWAEAFVRKGLVIFQFGISVILIVCVLVVRQQMALVQSINLGYDKNNIIRFGGDDDHKAQAGFLAEVKNIPGVLNATDMEGDLLGSAGHSGGGISWPGKDPNLKLEYYGNSVDHDFLETMGLQLAGGRTFSRQFSDSASVIFNETAIRAMGIKDPTGKMVSLWGKPMRIVGVVKDYHFESLYKKIGPAFFTFSPDNKNILVRIDPRRQQQALAAVQNLYRRYHPGLDFDYSFLDDSYHRLYASEQRVAVLTRYFAGMAILISCLGLFGLAAFTAQKRQKEIGIRKVIGASVDQVVAMLSRDFLLLVTLALAIAMPVAWWACHKWLQSFAYRVELSPLVFVLTALVTVVITLLTISFQSIKAALANPVKSLRAE
ncbi:ABC transporter permease [Mucilaginibacter sp. BJC16-A38]|uniref:ABC transporter permease n=1 Tax=Mucilaginibacter phenanthrenivorans TaxID=1234842 RepID=UPI0021589E1E|nr:ABC transporter permease [Mucilaginibacter phenanthrenivorans]MCR8556591.1 ABC transporter permease [Mucilaginibacter phenanthrenivorans]